MRTNTNGQIIFDVKRADNGIRKAFLSDNCRINETLLNKIIYGNGGGYSKEQFSVVLPVLIEDYRDFLRCESKVLPKHKHSWLKLYYSNDMYEIIEEIHRHIVMGHSKSGVVINNALSHAFREMQLHGLGVSARELFHWAKLREVYKIERGGENEKLKGNDG